MKAAGPVPTDYLLSANPVFDEARALMTAAPGKSLDYSADGLSLSLRRGSPN